jgi:hypothetical protein
VENPISCPVSLVWSAESVPNAGVACKELVSKLGWTDIDDGADF